MTLSRRQLITTGLGVAATAGLAGCAGLTSRSSDEGSSGGDATGPATLTFVNWSGDTEKKAFDALIAAFSKENPDITIKTDTVPYASIQTNLDSRFQAGNPPDLFRVSYIDIGQYTSQDVLLDVSGAFDQAAVDAVRARACGRAIVYDGKPYGVPHQIDTTAILYRKDAFEAAGITDVPTTLGGGLDLGGVRRGGRQARRRGQGQAVALHLRLAERRRVPLAVLAVPGRRQPARPRTSRPRRSTPTRVAGGRVHPAASSPRTGWPATPR